MIDLIALIPCSAYEKALEGIFSRHMALNVRSFTYKIIINTERDPGCRIKCTSFLRSFTNNYARALVVFDLDGSGAGNKTRVQVENEVETDLRQNGWANRSAAIVVDPEIEAWVWSDSPLVDIALNWQGHQPDVRTWLKTETDFWEDETPKPWQPKEAMELALRKVQKPMSSMIFKELADNVGLNRCEDPAFYKLKRTLKNWFGE
jgi:hypothetical protein